VNFVSDFHVTLYCIYYEIFQVTCLILPVFDGITVVNFNFKEESILRHVKLSSLPRRSLSKSCDQNDEKF
jgi:hypothetical protein